MFTLNQMVKQKRDLIHADQTIKFFLISGKQKYGPQIPHAVASFVVSHVEKYPLAVNHHVMAVNHR